jgi:hypothetical protein
MLGRRLICQDVIISKCLPLLLSWEAGQDVFLIHFQIFMKMNKEGKT